MAMTDAEPVFLARFSQFITALPLDASSSAARKNILIASPHQLF